MPRPCNCRSSGCTKARGLFGRAAALKAVHALSVADAWIATTALERGAVLVHKDPEFAALAEIEQDVLPYR